MVLKGNVDNKEIKKNRKSKLSKNYIIIFRMKYKREPKHSNDGMEVYKNLLAKEVENNGKKEVMFEENLVVGVHKIMYYNCKVIWYSYSKIFIRL